jgi:Spy/CpxP family protein refolding chaperone
MRTLLILTVSSAVLCSANIVTAEETGNPSPQSKPTAPAPGASLGGGVIINHSGGGNTGGAIGRVGGGKSSSEWYIESVNKLVPLTPDQQNTMMKIIEARDKAIQEYRAKNADKFQAANQAMTEAFKSQDKDAIAKAQKENQALYAGTTEIYSKAQKELDDVLTPDQKTKRQEARATQVMKSLTDGVTLTPEQEKKIKAVIAESGSGETRERASYQAVQDVLTPAQKATIARNRSISYAKMTFGRANLTPEQIQQVEAAYDNLAKSGNAAPGELAKKLNDAVNNLLTAEQKEKMKGGFTFGGAGATAAPGSPLILNRAQRK